MSAFRTDDQQKVIRELQRLGGMKGVTSELLRSATKIKYNVMEAVLRELAAEGVVEISPYKNFLGGQKWRLVPSAPVAAPAPVVSPDGRFWWNGAAWQPMPGLTVSPDGRFWWDGAAWQPMPGVAVSPDRPF